MLKLVDQHAPLRARILGEIDRLLQTGQFVLGEPVASFEAGVADYLGVKHAIGVASGTDALMLAFRAAGVGPGDEVITPPFSFFAISEAIHLAGADVVFADLREGTYLMDPELAVEAVTERTKAIVPVHLYGHPMDVAPLRSAIADQPRCIAVIEDAAQAFGASRGGTKAGALGDMATFSFYPTKNLGGCGDGGLVTTNIDAYAETIRTLRDHGQTEKYLHGSFGWNSRLDAMQAVILSAKLDSLDEWNEGRRRVAAQYRTLLADLPAGLPPADDDCVSVYHQFAMRVPGRDSLIAYLAEAGIASALHYPRCLHQQPAYERSFGSFPVAERTAAEIVCLPIYPELTEDEVSYVAETIRDWFHETKGGAHSSRQENRSWGER
ncbi:MAG: DegT/DnrJ/EryC1/StrS family aminotransferase [Gemmatimonadetes bacterium]|nr:DegT/DnrJ/EryC1/StrS family aminotransferase [Gemmatimonadota bacterium]